MKTNVDREAVADNTQEIIKTRNLVPKMTMSDREFTDEMRTTMNNVSVRMDPDLAAWMVFFASRGHKKSTLLKRCLRAGLPKVVDEELSGLKELAEKISNFSQSGSLDDGEIDSQVSRIVLGSQAGEGKAPGAAGAGSSDAGTSSSKRQGKTPRQ